MNSHRFNSLEDLFSNHN